MKLERVKGIEPSYSAWEAAALPLSYTRMGGDLSQSRLAVNACGARGFHFKAPSVLPAHLLLP